MVLITGYKKREAEGKEFYLLELEGDIEIVTSLETGQPYATTRKTSMSTTFNEAMCKLLIGRQLPGTVLKVEADDYEYTIKETGEVKILSHKYVYSANEHQTAEQAVFEQAVSV